MTYKKILSRQKKEKVLLLENLEKYPIIQIACEKTWISRATYYRWIEEDSEFWNKVEIAIQNWRNLVNDIAESNLISLVKEKHPWAIYYRLNNNHLRYSYKNNIQNVIIQTSKQEKKQIQNILSKLNTNEYEEANKKRNGVNDK